MKHITDKYINEINKVLWDFLWSGKKCTVSRSICTLPRYMGGLGLTDLKTVIKVKRVKWIIRVLKECRGQNWSKLIENYLRCLDNEFGIKFFTLKVDDSSDMIKPLIIPMFYKDCINYFQEMCRIARYKVNEDEIIWCNNAHRFNGQTLKMSHWARAGIINKSHLYKDGKLDEQGLYNRLKYKAGFIFEVSTIKSVFRGNIEYHTTPNVLQEKDDRRIILQYQFYVPGSGLKALEDLSSKDIYNIFLLSQEIEVKSKGYWCEKLNLNEPNWESWFSQNFMNKLIPRKVKDFNWKLFHGLVNTESRLKRMNYSDGICKICNTGEIEDIGHLLIKCNTITSLWKIIEKVILDSFGHIVEVNLKEVISGYWNQNNTHSPIEVDLINVQLGICKYHIWKIRNSIKYGNEEITYFQRLKVLKFDLETHLHILLSSVNISRDIKHNVQKVLNQVKKII